MGKHPVSTTIRMQLNRELEDLCKEVGCSKYAFIEEAIREKVEKTKVEREETKREDSGQARSNGKGHSEPQNTAAVDELDA